MIYSVVVCYNKIINSKTIDFCKNHGVFPVVFDNSTDSSIVENNKKYCGNNQVAYESFGGNVGLPKAYNHVIKKYLKEDDWLIVLDQDTKVPDEYFEKISKIVSNPTKECYFAIFKYGKDKYGPKVFKNYKKVGARKNKTAEHLDGYLIGINSCTLINKRVFDKIGLFNEDLFMDYVDIDLCVRLAANNIKSETIDIVIEQDFFSKSKSSFKSVKRRYANQLMDLSIFTKTLKTCWINKLIYKLKERTKFNILYSLHNNVLWFVPLCFSKKRHINKN